MKTKLFPKSIWNPLLTLVTLFFFQNWTGFIATVFYGVDIFQVCKLMIGPSINYVDIFLGVFLTLLHLSGHLCSKVIIRYPLLHCKCPPWFMDAPFILIPKNYVMTWKLSVLCRKLLQCATPFVVQCFVLWIKWVKYFYLFIQIFWCLENKSRNSIIIV